MNKNSLERRGFISFHSPRVTVLTEESQGRNQEAGNEMETMEKCGFLAWSLELVQLVFFYRLELSAQELHCPQ